MALNCRPPEVMRRRNPSGCQLCRLRRTYSATQINSPSPTKGTKIYRNVQISAKKNASRVQTRALPTHDSLSQCLGRGVASTPAASALGLVRGNLKNYKQLEQLVAFGHGYNYNPNWHPSLACGRTKAAEAFKKRRNEIHGRSNLAGVVAGPLSRAFENNSLNNFLFRETFLATAAPAVRQGVPGLCFTR